jgi:hypothetical protein
MCMREQLAAGKLNRATSHKIQAFASQPFVLTTEPIPLLSTATSVGGFNFAHNALLALPELGSLSEATRDTCSV